MNNNEKFAFFVLTVALCLGIILAEASKIQ
jgi:hypothetical protein